MIASGVFWSSTLKNLLFHSTLLSLHISLSTFKKNTMSTSDSDNDEFIDAVDEFQEVSSSRPETPSINTASNMTSLGTGSGSVSADSRAKVQSPVLPTQDSSEYPSPAQTQIRLSADLASVLVAIDLFLNSQFAQAEHLLLSQYSTSLYHSHGYAVVTMMKSLMSFEPKDIKRAYTVLDRSVSMAKWYVDKCEKVLEKRRRRAKKNGGGSSLRGIVGGIRSLVFGTGSSRSRAKSDDTRVVSEMAASTDGEDPASETADDEEEAPRSPSRAQSTHHPPRPTSAASSRKGVDEELDVDVTQLYQHARIIHAESMILKSLLGIILLENSSSDSQQSGTEDESSSYFMKSILSAAGSAVGMLAGLVKELVTLRSAYLVYCDLFKVYLAQSTAQKSHNHEEGYDSDTPGITLAENPQVEVLKHGESPVRSASAPPRPPHLKNSALPSSSEPNLDPHLTSALFLGMAFVHMILSILPQRLTALIQALGIIESFNTEQTCETLGLDSELCKSVGDFGIRLLLHHHFQNPDNETGEKGGLRIFLLDFAILIFLQILPMHVPLAHPYCSPASATQDQFLKGLLMSKVQEYPRSVFYLFFEARSAWFRVGKSDSALQVYDELIKIIEPPVADATDVSTPLRLHNQDHISASLSTGGEWRNLKHVCTWDMTWLHAWDMDWTRARQCISVLEQQSKWSRASYRYILACFLYMELNYPVESTRKSAAILDDNKDLVRKQSIEELFKSIPGLMQRIAGKHIPLEKFLARKSRKFESQGGRLFIPALEMMCLFCMGGGLKWVGGEKLRRVYDFTNSQIQNESQEETSQQWCLDDELLGEFVKGAVLKYIGDPGCAELSQATFESLIDRYQRAREVANMSGTNTKKDRVVLDEWMMPYSHYEIAHSHLLNIDLSLETMTKEEAMDRVKKARAELDKVKKDYKKFSLENRLVFRVHLAQKRCDAVEVALDQEAKSLGFVKFDGIRIAVI